MENNIIQTLKGRLLEYLANTGRTLTQGKNGPCPICGGSESSTRARLFEDGLGWYCWGGDCAGNANDLFSLIGHDHNTTDFKEQVDIASKLFGFKLGSFDTASNVKVPEQTMSSDAIEEQPVIDVEFKRIKSHKRGKDFTDYYSKCRENPEPAYKYLMEERCISREVCDAHNVGYDPAHLCFAASDPKNKVFKYFPSITIPITPNYYVSRCIEEKYFNNPKGAKVELDVSALDQDEPTFIVEGIIDAMSIETVGGKAIALHSVSNIKLLVEAIKKRTKLPFLLLALDEDDAGKAAQAELIKELRSTNARFAEVDIYDL